MHNIWPFINENSGALNLFVNTLMLGVWTFYLQMLFTQHRRARLAKILINRGAGHDLEARCIVSNMSAESIYLQALIFEYEDDDGERRSCSASNLNSLTKAPEGDPGRSGSRGQFQQEASCVFIHSETLPKPAPGQRMWTSTDLVGSTLSPWRHMGRTACPSRREGRSRLTRITTPGLLEQCSRFEVGVRGAD